jgi:hypothetical protein
MFTPVDPAIKEKVISAYLTGKGRNQITRELHEQGVRVSHGSISNIIGAYKRKHQQPSQPQVSLESSDASTGVDMYDTTSTAPRDGGPLSHLFEDPDSNSDLVVETWENIDDIDILPTKLEPFPSEDLETEMSKQAINQDDVNSHLAPEEKERGFEQPRPWSPLPDSENPPVDQDWNPDESYQTRFWNRIMIERRRRQEELLLIEQQRQELNIERQQIAQIRSIIDQQKYDLEVRQNKMIEYESLIPSARELRNCGISLELILPYLSAINEKAVGENIDLKTAANNLVNDIQEYRQLGLKTAANNLVYDIREYRQLGTLQNFIKQVKQQLSVLNAFNEQQKLAVTTLINLQLAGFSEKDINELIGLVTAWNKSGIVVPDFSQGNGRSSMNGFKLDDKLIGIGH